METDTLVMKTPSLWKFLVGSAILASTCGSASSAMIEWGDVFVVGEAAAWTPPTDDLDLDALPHLRAQAGIVAEQTVQLRSLNNASGHNDPGL